MIIPCMLDCEVSVCTDLSCIFFDGLPTRVFSCAEGQNHNTALHVTSNASYWYYYIARCTCALLVVVESVSVCTAVSVSSAFTLSVVCNDPGAGLVADDGVAAF